MSLANHGPNAAHTPPSPDGAERATHYLVAAATECVGEFRSQGKLGMEARGRLVLSTYAIVEETNRPAQGELLTRIASSAIELADAAGEKPIGVAKSRDDLPHIEPDQWPGLRQMTIAKLIEAEKCDRLRGIHSMDSKHRGLRHLDLLDLLRAGKLIFINPTD